MSDWIIVALIGLAMGAGTFVLTPGKARGGILMAMLIGAVSIVAFLWLVRYVGLVGRPSAFLIPMVGTGLILAIWRFTMARDTETL